MIYQNHVIDGDNSPVAAVHTLFMRDLMHEIGQTISIIGIISYNMNFFIESKKGTMESELLAPSVQNISKAVNDFSEFYGHLRSLGRPVFGTEESKSRWHVSAVRINNLTRLARERNGIVLSFNNEFCSPDWDTLLSNLELVLLCLVKENVSAWPKGVGGRIEMVLVPDPGPHETGPQVRIWSIADDAATQLPIVMTETALQLARHFRISMAAEGGMLVLSCHETAMVADAAPFGSDTSRKSGPDARIA